MAVMNRMRESMKTILLILVIAFMLTIIIDWGMGGFKTGQKPGVIGEINGTEIAEKDFTETFNNEIKMHRESTGAEPEGYQRNQIEDQVWEQYVQDILLEQAIRKARITTNDEEILYYLEKEPPEFIRNYQFFRDSTGAFNQEIYNSILANPQASQFWFQVEGYMRNYIPRLKLQTMLENSVNVNDLEVREEFARRNLKASADYIFFDPNKFQNQKIEISDAEINAYYEDHEKDFHEPEKRKINFVLFELKPTAKDTAAINTFAAELINRIQDGEDFGSLAEAYSEDKGSAKNGGDLGYFAKGAMVKAFEDAAFSAQVGTVVGPVASNFGLHIIKVEDRKTEEGEEKVKARHILLKVVASNETQQFTFEEAEYLAIQAKEEGLVKAAETDKRTVQNSNFFESGATIPGIGVNRRMNYYVFHNKVGKNEGPFYTERGYYVIEVAEIQKERTRPLADVKAQIQNTLTTEKRKELARAAARKFYEKIAANKALDQAAAEDSLEIKSIAAASYGAFLPGIGRDSQVMGALFGLNAGQISKPIEGVRGIYIIQVTQKDAIDEASYQAQKEAIHNQLLAQERQKVFRDWFDSLKKKADIKDYRALYL